MAHDLDIHKATGDELVAAHRTYLTSGAKGSRSRSTSRAGSIRLRTAKPRGSSARWLDAKGNFAAPHNSEAMYRGYVTRDGKMKVILYDD